MKKVFFIFALALGINGLYCQQTQAEKDLLWGMSGEWLSNTTPERYEVDLVSKNKMIGPIPISIKEINTSKKYVIFSIGDNDIDSVIKLYYDVDKLTEKPIKQLIIRLGNKDEYTYSLIKNFTQLQKEYAVAQRKARIESYKNQGDKYKEKKLWSQAINEYSKAIDLGAQDPDLFFMRGFSFYNMKNFDKAIADFTKAIHLKKNDGPSYYFRGMSFDAKGLYDQAIKDFSKDIELNPDAYGSYFVRGRAYLTINSFDQAIYDFSKTIKLSSNHVNAYAHRALAYNILGIWDKVIEDLSMAISIDPTESGLFSQRGVAYREKGLLDLALRDFNASIKNNPNDVLAYIYRGRTYYLMDSFELALSDLNKAIEMDPQQSGAYMNRGDVYLKQNLNDLALKDFNKAMGIIADRDDPFISVTKAKIYLRLKNYDKAWAELNKYKKLNVYIDKEFLDQLKKESGREQ